MYVVAFAALVVAQSGGAAGPLRLPTAADCVAVPMLMSMQVPTSARRLVRSREDRRAQRPTPRCLRLSAR